MESKGFSGERKKVLTEEALGQSGPSCLRARAFGEKSFRAWDPLPANVSLSEPQALGVLTPGPRGHGREGEQGLSAPAGAPRSLWTRWAQSWNHRG